MSGTQIALLRGVNVGSARRIAMADLRAVCERLGHREVRTLLNSGNVVFEAGRATPATSGRRIEQAIRDELGVSARVTVLGAAELAVIVAGNPLADVADNPSRLMVGVLADPEHMNKIAPLQARKWTPEALALGARVAYFWCPAGIIASPLAQALDRALRDDVTSRNWATITKLHALALHSSSA
jgi:uncharacterized protein (DUF1697 family)